MIQTVFQRYETKYRLTYEQYEQLLDVMSPYMSPDAYDPSTVRNVYYDTPSHLLARRSSEHPLYKEKLRIRSYTEANDSDMVFAEIKKKYDGITYKRRITCSYHNAKLLMRGRDYDDTQISHELAMCASSYRGLKEAMFIAYDREAYYCDTDDTFRMTFDQNIRCRWDNLTLSGDTTGLLTSPEYADTVLLEVKSRGALPIWLVQFFSANHIYKTSYSKYCKAVELQSAMTDGVFEEVPYRMPAVEPVIIVDSVPVLTQLLFA